MEPFKSKFSPHTTVKFPPHTIDAHSNHSGGMLTAPKSMTLEHGECSRCCPMANGAAGLKHWLVPSRADLRTTIGLGFPGHFAPVGVMRPHVWPGKLKEGEN